jgi:chemotaxis protein histidine kinase CheA
MKQKNSSIAERLNGIAANLPLLEKTDLVPLAKIQEELEAIRKEPALPQALQTQIGRTVSLVDHILMGETAFDEGCAKLGESIGKMRRAVGKPQDDKEKDEDGKEGMKGVQEAEPGELNDVNESENGGAIPDDLRDLVTKFAGSQQAVLEDFEAFILEWEKGAPPAKAALQRILHTWKGEFGVLDMRDFSGLLHEVEERIETGTSSCEKLLSLKDFLAESMHRFAAGIHPPISAEQRKAILGEPLAKESGKEQKSTPPADKPPLDAAPLPQVKAETIAPAAPLESEAHAPQTLEGDPSLTADFINESREHIHTAETMLLELETEPTNAGNIDSVFRAWHTIKGVAGFLNLKTVSRIAHSMESLMDRARKRELVLDPAHIDLLLESNDCLKTFVGIIEEATCNGTSFTVPDNYDALLKRLTSPATLSSQGASAEGMAAEKKIGEILAESGSVQPQSIEDALAKQRAGDTRKIGEILIDDKKIAARAVGQALATQTAARVGAAIEETIRVPVNRIDQLVDTIGEAVIAQSMINADPAIRRIEDQALHSKIAHSEMIMRQIQELAMSLRMVSIKSTFQKMARLVRDLAKKSNKEVNFVTEGEDTELDKSVVENIGDPLIHMIRNSVDHGIEAAAERATSGLPQVARSGADSIP